MAVIAIIQSAESILTLVDHAVWAAAHMHAPIRFVAVSPDAASDPALEFDAYQRMDTQDDMRLELIAAERGHTTPDIDWGVELVQSAAKAGRAAGASEVSTEVVDESLQQFVELGIDSTDLLVVPRSEIEGEHGQLTHIHRRMILAVPQVFTGIETWLLAYNGIGRPIEFLTNTGLLRDINGTAIVAGDDGHTKLHFRDAMQHLGNVGYAPTTHELSGSAEDIVAAVIAVTSPSLLVASIGGQDGLRSRLGRGGVPRFIREFTGPVLLAVD